jgi:hypothetical protein
MPPGPHPSDSGERDLYQVLWAYRRTIVGALLLGALGGLIASFLIRPLFRSEVVMFPAVTNSVSRSLLNEQSTGRDDILALGDEQDAAQLLQMLQSDRVRDRVAAEFDLMSVYRIDPQGRHPYSDLRSAFESHVKFQYTRFGSVRVSVLDPDPRRAADIANFIASEVDSVWKEMARERADKGLRIVERMVHELEASMRAMDDSLRQLRRLGVHDYLNQSERYNEYLGAAIVKGDQRAIKEFEERFAVLAEHGGTYVAYQDLLFNESKRLSVLRMKLEQAQADRDSDLPHKFLVNPAQPSDKPAWPVRWLLVVAGAVSTVLAALLGIAIRQGMRKLPTRP